jgi:hypothetical protein
MSFEWRAREVGDVGSRGAPAAGTYAGKTEDKVGEQ